MKHIVLIFILIFSTISVWSQKKTTKSKNTKQTTKQATKKTTPANKNSQSGSANSSAQSQQDHGNIALGDTSRTVIITSSFKPELRNANKVHFGASIPPQTTEAPDLQYSVPSQNLFFTYQPTTLKPLALVIDTTYHWTNSNYIKGGFGNYSTPLLEAALSFGDGRNRIINVNFNHISSSRGGLPFQEYGKTGGSISGIFNSDKNVEYGGKLFVDESTQYLYGFQPDSLKYVKSDLKQRFTTFGAEFGLRNKVENELGINYSPSLHVDLFRDNHKGRESSFGVKIPVSKSISEDFSANLIAAADITTFKTDTSSINNNLFYIAPSVQYHKDNVNVVGGFLFSAYDGDAQFLPDIKADVKINEEKFILQAGWTGAFEKVTYRSLASENPWLLQPSFLNKKKTVEQYAGLKGSLGSHITYNGRISYLKINNQPLFVNDTITGKSFQVINESEMKVLRIHGEIGYTIQEKFSVLGGLTFNQYNNLKDNPKAYGLLPLEINGSLRWWILKDVLFKSDVYFWDGAQYRTKTLGNDKLDPAVDLNAGIEVKVLPRWNVWLQVNNLFNNKYQRWNQYEVYGINVLGGITYSFDQKK